ncbi:MAG: VRR-NUC domain-containing protein [Eubacteriales bacterium]|nr:VRR-NUC domain-containing protein [Eubacteriales bacterium]
MRNFRRESEDGNQEALFVWAAVHVMQYPELAYLHHIPNGGKRDRMTAIALKRRGVRAGVPDISLPVSRGGFHGLYIELKAGTNRATEHQRRWMEFLGQQGYMTAICYGWESAAQVIETYLTDPEKIGSAGQVFRE